MIDEQSLAIGSFWVLTGRLAVLTPFWFPADDMPKPDLRQDYILNESWINKETQVLSLKPLQRLEAYKSNEYAWLL